MYIYTYKHNITKHYIKIYIHTYIKFPARVNPPICTRSFIKMIYLRCNIILTRNSELEMAKNNTKNLLVSVTIFHTCTCFQCNVVYLMTIFFIIPT